MLLRIFAVGRALLAGTRRAAVSRAAPTVVAGASALAGIGRQPAAPIPAEPHPEVHVAAGHTVLLLAAGRERALRVALLAHALDARRAEVLAQRLAGHGMERLEPGDAARDLAAARVVVGGRRTGGRSAARCRPAPSTRAARCTRCRARTAGSRAGSPRRSWDRRVGRPRGCCRNDRPRERRAGTSRCGPWDPLRGAARLPARDRTRSPRRTCHRRTPGTSIRACSPPPARDRCGTGPPGRGRPRDATSPRDRAADGSRTRRRTPRARRTATSPRRTDRGGSSPEGRQAHRPARAWARRS